MAFVHHADAPLAAEAVIALKPNVRSTARVAGSGPTYTMSWSPYTALARWTAAASSRYLMPSWTVSGDPVRPRASSSKAWSTASARSSMLVGRLAIAAAEAADEARREAVAAADDEGRRRRVVLFARASNRCNRNSTPPTTTSPATGTRASSGVAVSSRGRSCGSR